MSEAQIMVVEDDRLVAEDIQASLKSLGFAVSSVVTHGEEAIYSAKENSPDLVLMDITLKGAMDGIEAAGQIRSQLNIPVVYVTASADEQVVERAKITEPFGYITKPLQERQLKTAIEIALYKHKAEQAVKLAYVELNQIFQTAADGMRVVDKDFNVLRANETFSRLSGKSNDQAVGKKCYEVFPGPVCQTDQCTLSRIVAGEEHVEEEVEKERSDGTRIPCIVRATPFRGPDGTLIGIVQNFTDISEHKRAQEALAQSEKRYRAFVQDFQGVAFQGKIDFTPIFFHGAVQRITGYTEEEFTAGKPRWNQVIHPDDIAKMQKNAERIRLTPNWKSEREYRIIRKNGEIRWIQEFIQNICDDSGKPFMVQGVIYDITDRKRVEQKLKEANERRADVLESISDGFLILDDKLIVTYFNKAAEQLLGRKAEEVLGRNLFETFPEAKGSIFEQNYTMAVEDKKHISFETYFGVKPYQNWYEIRVYPYKDGISVYFQVTTDRKRVEEEREALIAELESKNAELERFTYSVSHDLKSPLITISGFVGLLKKDLAQGGKGERVEADIAYISKAAKHMEQLLDELLELSRVGRVINPPTEVSLNEIAREALSTVAGRVSDRGVKVEIAPDLPVVYADRPRIVEVLGNLIDNAVKFMGDQPDPCVEIGARREGKDAVFFVRDNGIGIDPVYHDKIFALFDKLDHKAEGTGVGLAIVKRIVELHSGRIWIESEGTGTGSSFCFTLPAKEA